ncbi:Gfo/Idh/MocA family oxidoreductase [Candidatus Pelagisphaera phototrophica]|nr:Gfo/Idh/MocA family oxidoreductase [Candidatus Pelagisphaera phototrophica]
MDQDHVGPAVACMEKGYHMLLEKPMAVRFEDCQKIAAAQARNGVITSVCHSMRYHKGFATEASLKERRVIDIVSFSKI